MDLGILVDASGSVGRYFELEREFVRRMGAQLNVHLNGSQIGVVVFSSGSFVRMVIPFSQEFKTLKDFNDAVSKIPHYKYQTRIDKALRVANDELFNEKNGMRPGVKKVVILLTDGKQQPPATRLDGREKVFPPEVVAGALHNRDIPIQAIGIGSRVDEKQLQSITRSPESVYLVDSFDDLVNDDFLRRIAGTTCSEQKKVFFD